VRVPSAKTDVRRAGEASDHFVQFYEDESRLADAVTNFAAASLQEGNGAVVIATPRHRVPVAQRLARRGLDLDRLEADGRWAPLDAEESLDRFLVDGMPDASRFRAVIEPVIDRARVRGRTPRVCAFGEMVAVLWERGSREAAIALEGLWNDLLREHTVSLFCAYPLRAFGGERAAQEFLQVCGPHDHVLPSEDTAALEIQDQQHPLVLELQRQAVALGEEVARRREIEDLLHRREREIFDYLEGTAESVVDVGPAGAVRWGNDAFRALIGDAYAEGRSLRDALVPSTSFDEIWAKLLRGEAVDGLAVVLRSSDGRLERLRIRLGVLRAAGRDMHMRWFLDRGPVGA
jgi:hypothetical protein